MLKKFLKKAPQPAEKASASRRKFLTGATATAATAGAAITGFPMISVAQSPVVIKMRARW